MYLMECTLCKKKYVGDAEAPFSERLNNYRNDVKVPHLKTILSCKHFQENKSFNKHAKFIIIDKLTNTRKPKEIL